MIRKLGIWGCCGENAFLRVVTEGIFTTLEGAAAGAAASSMCTQCLAAT